MQILLSESGNVQALLDGWRAEVARKPLGMTKAEHTLLACTSEALSMRRNCSWNQGYTHADVQENER